MNAINALTRNVIKVVPRATASIRRTFAVESRAHLYTGFPRNWNELKNNIWLSDPGAYPVMIVLSFAVGMCGSFMTYFAVTAPDVRITPGRRQQLVRTWE